jgi:hypothetical protein
MPDNHEGAVILTERERMADVFDTSDPYQVHAYLLLGFICSSCGAELDIGSRHEMPNDLWCIDAASQARREGWLFPSAANEFLGETVLFCGSCLAVAGQTMPPT